MASIPILSYWRRSEIALPLIAGFLARLAMFPLAQLGNPRLLEYGFIARLLAEGNGYSMHWIYGAYDLVLPTAYMLPGQVMIQYLGLGLLGDTLAGHIFIFLEQVVIGTVFVYAMWRIVGTLGFAERPRRIGAWLAAIYPSFLVAASSFGVINAVITIDALLFWSLLALSSRLRMRQPAYRTAITSGALGGLLALFRSESYPLLFSASIIIAWQFRDVPKLVPNLAIATFAFLLVVSPWVARNYMVFHRFIPTSTTAGFNFWRGHNRDATGSSWDKDGHAIWTTDTMWNEIEPARQVDSNVEFSVDAYHFKKAKEWIASHPKIEIERTLRKGALLWGIDWYSKDARRPAYLILYSMTFISVIAGILRVRRERLRSIPIVREAMNLIGLWCLFYTAIVMAFFSLPRLQIIMIGVYFPLVIYGADWIIGKVSSLGKSSFNSMIS